MAAGIPIAWEESNEDKLADAKKDAASIKAERKTAQQRLDSLKADKADLEKYVQELDKKKSMRPVCWIWSNWWR